MYIVGKEKDGGLAAVSVRLERERVLAADEEHREPPVQPTLARHEVPESDDASIFAVVPLTMGKRLLLVHGCKDTASAYVSTVGSRPTTARLPLPQDTTIVSVSTYADNTGITLVLSHSFGTRPEDRMDLLLDLDSLALLALAASAARWADDPTSGSFRDLLALARLYALPHRPTPRVAVLRVAATPLPVQTLLADPVNWEPQDPMVRAFFAVGVDPWCSLLWSPADEQVDTKKDRSLIGSVASAVASSAVARWWGGGDSDSGSTRDSSSSHPTSPDDDDRIPVHELRVPALLADSSSRVGTSVVTSPCGTFALVGDCLGRVSLILVQTCTVIRMWKGYRQARFAFSPNLEVVLQAPHRSLLEVWAHPGNQCVAATILQPHIHILPHLPTDPNVTAFAWDTEKCRLMRLAPVTGKAPPTVVDARQEVEGEEKKEEDVDADSASGGEESEKK
jgi:hypothetical protein